MEYDFMELTLNGCNAYVKGKGGSTIIPSYRLDVHAREVKEDGLILDMKARISQDDGTKLVMECPMLDMTLPNNGYRRNQAREIGKKIWRLDDAQGLDYVGLGNYLAYWLAHGARTGVRKENAIEWNDGTKTELFVLDLKGV